MSEWDAAAAEWYAEKYGTYPTNRLGVTALDLAADAVIVDIGCGTGEALRHAAVSVTEGQLIGVDPVDRMLEIAREWTADHPARDRIVYRPGRASALPVDDASADVVLAFDTYDHWKDPVAGLREVRRVLKPGGRFAVLKDRIVPQERDFATEAQQAGFTILEQNEVHDGDIHFGWWVCQR